MPWLWHQLEEGVSDFNGHSHPMRDLAGFLDLAAEKGMFIIARPGPYIMAESINEGIPPWVFDKYPQVAFISQDHKIQNVASYMHPDFLACAKKWYRAVFEILTPRQITRGGKIIMVQLDNEMGMIKWVRNIFDINPDTLSRFALYLQKTYGDQLSSHYPLGNLAEFLGDGLSNPAEPYAVKIVEDYRRFYREYLRDYASFLWSEARSNGLDVPPIVNVHGFMSGGRTFPIGLSQLIEVMRMQGMVSATDVYPGFIGEGNFHQLLMVNEITKTLQIKQQPLFSVEFQAGGNNDFSGNQSSLYDLHSRLCISSGMRAINHYLFFDGENDPILSLNKRHDWGHPVRKDGTLRGHFARYPKLSSVLHSYGTDLILARPESVATIGFQLDNFMTEVCNESTQESTRIITHQREVILFDLIARGLSLTHRPFNTVELASDDLNAIQTPILWVMLEKQCNSATQEKLVDYVKTGGKLVLAGRMCLENFDHQECMILKDALGITQIHGGVPFAQGLISAFGYQDIPVSFLETYTVECDEVIATAAGGEITGFSKTLGKGKVMLLGAAFAANTLGDLDIIHQMALKMDCQPLFKLGTWADVRLSRGEKGSFLFINNYQDDPVETTIEYKEQLLFGGQPVSLPARRGAILPLDWQVSKGVLVHYVTSEIVGKTEAGATLTLRTGQPDFFAELTLSGYSCDGIEMLERSVTPGRIKLHANDGCIVLRQDG